MTIQQKPILHGRDHATNGPDPIPGMGGGIQFDVENDGGWLYITTEDATEAGGSPTGHGILLDDFSGGGVYLAAHSGGIFEIHTVGGGDVVISSTNDLTVGPLHATAVGATTLVGKVLEISSDVVSGVSIKLNGGDVTFQIDNDHTVTINVPAGVLTFSDGASIGAQSASKFELADSALSPVLQVLIPSTGGTPPPPEFHIKTGATWVADL